MLFGSVLAHVAPVVMKRILIVAAVVLSVGLSSCQCADKPDVGPVEGDDEQSRLVEPPVEGARLV